MVKIHASKTGAKVQSLTEELRSQHVLWQSQKNFFFYFKETDFPGGPVAKTPRSQYSGPEFPSLAREPDPSAATKI